MPFYRYLKLPMLANEPDIGKLLGWIMAANDLTFTFYMQEHFHSLSQDRKTRDFVTGSNLFADRLMFSLASEALAMVRPSSNSQLFMRAIATHGEAENAFERLLFLMTDNSTENQELNSMLARIRNKGTFHYYNERDPQLRQWMRSRLQCQVANGSRLGSAVFDTHSTSRFIFVDDIFADVFFKDILLLSGEAESMSSEIRNASEKLVGVASDIRVVGDTIGKALLDWYAY